MAADDVPIAVGAEKPPDPTGFMVVIDR